MRGKHAQAAAARQQQTAEALAPYQRKVATLSAQVRDLKAAARRQQEAHAREVRRLKAERDEGMSPAVTVAQRENKRLREERDAAVAQRDSQVKQYRVLADKVLRHWRGAHGLTVDEALTAFCGMFEGQSRFIDWERIGNHLSDEGARAVIRARGGGVDLDKIDRLLRESDNDEDHAQAAR